MIKSDTYFVLSSSCKLVKGAKRAVIIDYQRGELYYISGEYFSLLNKLDREKLFVITDDLDDDESMRNFNEFLSIILTHEIGFLTDTPEQFPLRSDDTLEGEPTLLIDVIIEVDPAIYDKEIFAGLCEDLNVLKCKDFQIRLFSSFDLELLTGIIQLINTTDANYIEVHCNYSKGIERELHDFIDANPLVSNIYLYDSPGAKVVDIINDIPNRHPLLLGNVYYIPYPFDGGNCCGVINWETLNYSSIDTHNLLKKRNGCLDRKITIDKHGNIKNCPSLKAEYGNIRDISIKEVLKSEAFQKLWFIHKDQISVCKVCEFRYNCTDCRAFLQDPDDIYSKPSKCGYNPYTCTWEEWSTSPLISKGIYIN